MRSRFLAVVLLLFAVIPCLADGPADNNIDSVRQIPPPGIEIPAADREKLEAGLERLTGLINRLKLRRDARTPQLLTDVEIFHRAIQQALDFNELYNEREIKGAHEVLAEGISRAEALMKGETPWTTQTGLVVRGYRSKLDGTVQPYGLVIPEDYSKEKPARCDLWFHGRGERSLETQFIVQRMHSAGNFEPPGTIVLHPYGRYSNAFKFAGEVDVWEALEHAKANYNIDDNRVAVRGFSMGGAGAWHFTVHYPRQFFASNPGAGFSETPEFLKSFQGETLNPPSYEETLWQMYDCPPWVENLKLIPTVAYSGEIDRQKQAADVMEAACEQAGMKLTHIIGPQTAHKIHPDSAVEITRLLAEIEQAGRTSPEPFTALTCTLKYDDFGRIVFHNLDEHWKFAKVTFDQCAVSVSGTTDVTVQIHRDKQDTPVTVNGQAVAVTGTGDLTLRLHQQQGKWLAGEPSTPSGLHKRHELQGPIDDAFMQPFLLVSPEGKAFHEKTEAWAASELQHAATHWRQHMRGDARQKAASEVTEQDIANCNLVLFGDPSSNALIQRVLPKLPIKWTKESITIGDKMYPADSHVPVLIYPNPLNPERYIVLNSGFTYREYDYLNNARQTPKLPDWAVIDVQTPINSRWPGKVVDANFFNEQWQLKD
ncbi:MAG: hypothetical protein KDA88_04025 [Planctomycetaceae bacterium]|nr:hypothetical protein [Planctomycetaceae bacterium]MCB9953363.1 hypothetical protein [Planctomycetaceae bacterium]